MSTVGNVAQETGRVSPSAELLTIVTDFVKKKKGLGDWEARLEKRQRELDEREKLLKTIPSVKVENEGVPWMVFIAGFVFGVMGFYCASQLSREITFIRSDMPFEMQEKALELIEKAFSAHPNDEFQIARYIKSEFEKTHSGQWQCVVGKFFKFDINHQTDRFIDVKLGKFEVVLFRKDAANAPLNLKIHYVKMSQAAQNEAIEIVAQALDKGLNEIEIARQLKTTFDKKHGSTWQSLVGPNLGFSVLSTNDSYIFFKIQHLEILLFKTK